MVVLQPMPTAHFPDRGGYHDEQHVQHYPMKGGGNNVEVAPNADPESPSGGGGENQGAGQKAPFQALLQDIWPPPGSSVSEIMDYPSELEKTVSAMGGEFEGYNHLTGELRFRASTLLSLYDKNAPESIRMHAQMLSSRHSALLNQAYADTYPIVTVPPTMCFPRSQHGPVYRLESPHGINPQWVEVTPGQYQRDASVGHRKRKAPADAASMRVRPSHPHRYHPERATCGLGRPQRYVCDYCGHCKMSSSSSSDGAVRIRCPCGGMQGDGINRMHAKWTPEAQVGSAEGWVQCIPRPETQMMRPPNMTYQPLMAAGIHIAPASS
eukprot:TRINITY_DN5344_c0_g1_i1.p1 TRINITY_DN5344_c0_g1~~TRINITY_DN5344_c0_g1_i1.p1  ORF type:complete len:324 (+),score=26.36 TRINITY_DN5344_c0_g1_i1:377-1348(+)